MCAEGPRLESPEEVGARFGLWHVRGLVPASEMESLADLARWWCKQAPLARPTMRDGTGLSVLVSSVGDVGWWADRGGYRYVARHPKTGKPWPAMPVGLRLLAERCLRAAVQFGAEVDAMRVAESFDTCLLNYYAPGASLGWHRDVTEEDRTTPIVNVSIGAPARFEIIEHIGEETTTQRLVLESGDVVVMAGASRLAEHRIVGLAEAGLFSPPSPLASGRLSFTFRRAQQVDESREW